jgi:hypothetical protein
MDECIRRMVCAEALALHLDPGARSPVRVGGERREVPEVE